VALRWKYETWRKLYVREEGTFAQLPLYTRALAKQLLTLCDRDGRIPLGGKSPADAVAFQCGANRGDRRMLKRDIPSLISDGYLIEKDGFLVIRNFHPAQEGHDRAPTDPPSSNDGATTEQRHGHDPSTTEPRQSNDNATKQEPSAHDSNGTDLALIPSLLPSLDRVRGFSALSKSKKSRLKKHLADALHVWDRMNAERQAAGKQIGVRVGTLAETGEALVRVADRLHGGATVDDCEKVIATAAHKAVKQRSLEWFNATTPWRLDNFDRLKSQWDSIPQAKRAAPTPSHEDDWGGPTRSAKIAALVRGAE
jgi:hypothetical protein